MGRAPYGPWALPPSLASATGGLLPPSIVQSKEGKPRRAALRTRCRLHHRHDLEVGSVNNALGDPNRGLIEASTRINDVIYIVAISACIPTSVHNDDAGHRRDGREPETELALD
jgi:hypothetical protein